MAEYDALGREALLLAGAAVERAGLVNRLWSAALHFTFGAAAP